MSALGSNRGYFPLSTIISQENAMYRMYSEYTNEAPIWLSRQKFSGVIGLDYEIRKFHRFMQQTREEKSVYEAIIKNLKEIISSKFENCSIEVFGSQAQGFSLPMGDIDLSINGEWERYPFPQVAQLLNESKNYKNVEIHDNTTIPIVVATDIKTNISIDISFNNIGGIEATKFILNFKEKYPDISYLVIAIKYFLKTNNLSKVYMGGLSSYGVFIMVASFVQNHDKIRENAVATANLGVLLMEFFHFYAHIFRNEELGISLINGFFKIDNPGFIHLSDPVNEADNVARSCFRYKMIKTLFKIAYSVLENSVRITHERIFHLKKIIKPEKSILDFKKIHNSHDDNGSAISKED